MCYNSLFVFNFCYSLQPLAPSVAAAVEHNAGGDTARAAHGFIVGLGRSFSHSALYILFIQHNFTISLYIFTASHSALPWTSTSS
jgi:hypothetical protein